MPGGGLVVLPDTFTFAADLREVAQMIREDHPNHSVCTSTDSTAGRSRTIGFQLSPASAEQ